MGGKDRKKRTKGRTDEKTDRQNQRHTQLYMYIVEIIQCLVNQRRRTNKHPLPYFLTEIITYQDQGNIIILHKITIALNVMSTLLKSVPMALVFNACRKHETIVSIQNNQCFTQITYILSIMFSETTPKLICRNVRSDLTTHTHTHTHTHTIKTPLLLRKNDMSLNTFQLLTIFSTTPAIPLLQNLLEVSPKVLNNATIFYKRLYCVIPCFDDNKGNITVQKAKKNPLQDAIVVFQNGISNLFLVYAQVYIFDVYRINRTKKNKTMNQ